MMMQPRRGGFTLLEVLLASTIALLLLAALYAIFDVSLKQADIGRESVQRGDLMRAVTNRMNIDLACCIGPMPPKSGGGIPEDTPTGGTTTPSTTTPSTSGTTGTTGNTMSSAETAAGVATGTYDLSESEGTAAADLTFQAGVFGSDKQLTLFVSRVPPALSNPETANPLQAGMIDMRPDLRRVTYYMSSGGLCRQEKPWVTADGVRNSADPDRADEAGDLLSEEVKDVTFSYFDGTAWVGSWTGADANTDGATVKGPPRAIMITMTIQQAGTDQPRTVSHVIPVRAACGLYQPPAAEEEVVPDPATTGM